MGLNDAIKGKLEQFAINYFIGQIESGKYGQFAEDVWFGIKGKKAIIGWALFAIGGAIALYPSPATLGFGSTLAVVGAYLGRFGLAVKGADKQPPPFPEEYRPAAEFVLSASTYVMELLTAVGGLMMLSGSCKADEWSMSLVLIGQGLSTATGYFATLIGKPPTPPEDRPKE